ncbi:protease inhibitor I42 family protein [Streptococcus dentiloxodontae]
MKMRRWFFLALLALAISNICLAGLLYQAKQEVHVLKIQARNIIWDIDDIQVQKNDDNFKLTFASNGSTGYDWLVKDVPSGLKLGKISNKNVSVFESEPNELRTGSSSLSYLKGKALKDGKYDFQLIYKRSWEDKALYAYRISLECINKKIVSITIQDTLE